MFSLQCTSDVFRKRIAGHLDLLVVLAAEAVPRSAAMEWRRVRDNRIGSKLGIPIGSQPDVAPRKTSADLAGPRNSHWRDRARQVHSCTAAPADSAGV